MSRVNHRARQLGKLHDQLVSAPAGAVFVCGTFEAVEQTAKMAVALGRTDLTVYHVSDLQDSAKLAKHHESTRVFFDELARDPTIYETLVSKQYALKPLVRAVRGSLT